MRWIGWMLLGLGLVLGAPAMAALAPEEERIVAAVDAGLERDIGLLERLVNQNSGTLNP